MLNLNFARQIGGAAFALALASTAQAAVIYSNGAVVDGAGLSILNPPATTLGYGAQISANNRVADDFTVPVGTSWNVQSISLFAYQTGANDFTFTSAAWRIVAGDLNTGTVLSSGLSNAVTNEGLVGHRVLTSSPGTTNRPIYQIGVDIPDLVLGSGSYWLSWSLDGRLGSGPFVPSLSFNTSGNGSQSVNGNAFGHVVEVSSQMRSELPFALNGDTTKVPEPTSLALVLAAGVAAAAARRGHGTPKP